MVGPIVNKDMSLLSCGDCTQAVYVMEMPVPVDFTPQFLLDAGNYAGCNEEGQKD